MERIQLRKKMQARMKYRRTAEAFVLVLIGLNLLLLLSLTFSVCTGIAGGNIKILVETVVRPADASDIGKIMLDMRMPRALTACFTGAAFALSGAVMQGLTRNPLADAGLLGINAGAGFFVALSVVLLPSASNIVTVFAAFAGAAFAVLLVYGFGAGKRKTESFRLILAGAAISALLTAMSQAVSLSFWSAGSLSGITWQSLKVIVPFIVAAGLVGFTLSGHLSALALGEDSAVGLGINVRSVRLIGILVVLLLAGASVSLVGGISFLGLIIPHISRFLVGGDYRRVMPVSALLGGVVLVLADAAARKINAPFDTPVGALVSIIGVPVFFALTYRKEAKAL